MTLRILVVDEEENVTRAIRRALHVEHSDWETTTANGHAAAIAALESDEFDVIVSDTTMAGSSGTDLLDFVAREYPATVRILLSGKSNRDAIFRSVSQAHISLAKPCDIQVLSSAIQRSCRLRDVLQSSTLRQTIAGIAHLPSPPVIFLKLRELLEDDDTTMTDVGALIQQDPALTAKLLQLVNSSFFSLGRRVTSPAQAAAHLGLDVLKNLIGLLEISQIMAVPSIPGFSLERLQEHSLEVGTLAQLIVRKEGGTEAEAQDAHLAGILHDCGKLLLAAAFPQRYSRLLAIGAVGESEAIERSIFQSSHAEVGGYLLALWGLPDLIVEAVAFHHRPKELGEGCGLLVVALHAADILCSRRTIDQSRQPERLGKFEFANRLPDWIDLNRAAA